MLPLLFRNKHLVLDKEVEKKIKCALGPQGDLFFFAGFVFISDVGICGMYVFVSDS